MKKTLHTILFTALFATQTVAQTTEGNFSYFLPKTEMRVALLIEKTSYTPGQLADYSELMFKTKASNEASVEYRIVGATLSTAGVPDNEKQYSLLIDKKHSIFSIDCNKNGVLKAINTKGKQEEIVVPFQPSSKPKQLNPADYMSQDILSSGNFPKMARLVAQEIYDIRDSRTQLTRGEADFMPKDGEQLKIMLSQLDVQEKALLQTFEGVVERDTTETIITFIPKKEESKKMIFRFSKHFGLTTIDDLSGDAYYAVITDENLIADPPTTDEDTKKRKDDLEIGINLPGKIRIDITNGKQSLLKSSVYAAQYGRVEVLNGSLFGKKQTSRLVMNTTTGAVESLITEPLE